MTKGIDMKEQFDLPPDAYARLRMLSELLAAGPPKRLRPAPGSVGGIIQSAGVPPTAPGRIETTAQRGK
jgi:hypothetical protein